MTLWLTRREQEWLREKFPLDLDDYSRRTYGSVRQLDWKQGPQVNAWVELSTGSLILVEALGDEERHVGLISARMWLAPVNRLVQLSPPSAYGGDSVAPMSHAAVLDGVLAAVERHVPGLTR